MKHQNLINFLIELKQKIRNSGRTNIITIRELEEMFVEYDINLKELRRMQNEQSNKT